MALGEQLDLGATQVRRTSRPRRLRILIRTDVRLYGQGLCLVLEREPDIEVVASSDSADDGLGLVARLQPDVVLLDSGMPDSVVLIRQIQRMSQDVKIVALALEDSEQEVVSWVQAGVAGYVTRHGSAADLAATVRRAVRGEALCSPRVVAGLMQRLAAMSEGRGGPDRDRLTPRELQVVRLIDEGLSNKEIASRLCIEVPTVKSHVHSILSKLGARRRGQVGARMRAGAL